MLEKIVKLDQDLFLFLNSKHIGWLDPVMLVLSSYEAWILACLVMLIFVYIKSTAWKRTVCISLLLTAGLSALFTNIVKFFVARPRPIHNEAWTDTIHAIERYSSSTSFFSSHSSTTFALALFFFMFVTRNGLNKIYGYIAIVWAALVAYSRIYLAKHYPIDVAVGILFGIVMGILGYKLYEYYISIQIKSSK